MAGDIDISPTEMLTVDQVAEHLGVSANTVRVAIRKGRLRGYKVGPKFYRIAPAALADYIQPGAE